MVGLGLAALFIFFNGFFVAAEFALVKLRAHPRQSQKRGERERVAVAASGRAPRQILGGDAARHHVGQPWPGMDRRARHDRVGQSPRRIGLGTRRSDRPGKGVVVAIAFSILTLAHVLFGELVPKLVAIQRSKQAAAVTVPLLRVAYVLLYPGLWVLEACSRAVLKLIKLPFDAYGEAALSEDEILGILAANVAREPRGEQKHELMRRVVRFSARTAQGGDDPPRRRRVAPRRDARRERPSSSCASSNIRACSS